MDCSWLTKNLGYDCRPVQGVNHGAVLEIDTPFSFSDGEPIAFYAREQGGVIILSDNGDTLAHLMAMGLSVSDKRRWASLRSRLEGQGLTLNSHGEVQITSGKASASEAIARYLSGMMVLVEYERDALSTPVDTHVFVDEVEMYLREWRPRETLTLRPKVKGISRREHLFDFQLGSTLVDAINPHANATGGIMRKAGDVLSGPFTDSREIMVIIDDRFDLSAAVMERDIISSIVKAMLFSDLARSSGHANITH